MISRILTHRPTVIILLVLAILGLGNTILQHKTASALNNDETLITIDKELAHSVDALSKPILTLPKSNQKSPLIYARSYVVIDGTSKYPLASKNPDVNVPIASTTKIMTALVTLDTLPLDQVVTITPEASAIPGSQMNFIKGEKHTVHNLLYALMMNSANDAAVALSQANGTTEEFVSRMNKKAQTLGLANTHYIDPAGLEEGSQSSPRDLALMLDYALGNKTFRSIVGTQTHTITSVDNRYTYQLNNSNRLIHPDEPLYLPSTIGGKTGFTYEAGHCLIAAYERADGSRLIAAVLHTNSDDNDASAKEARKLLTWANQL
ncbi:MAG TPA: serine hydrolase [Patescibacteria group bacterium]